MHMMCINRLLEGLRGSKRDGGKSSHHLLETRREVQIRRL